MTPKAPSDRSALHWLISGEISSGNEPAICRHILSNQRCSSAPIKAVPAVISDPPERSGEFGLFKQASYGGHCLVGGEETMS